MKDIFEQLNGHAKEVSLSSEEKQDIRSRLVVFAENPQVRNRTDVRQLQKVRKKLLVSLFIFKLRPMFIALMIALVLGGGTAFAAENALPGDTLYPVKIHVNEQFRDAIEVSAEDQVEWDLKKAERRLVEAQKLAQKGILNSNIRADLSNRIDLLLTRVENHGEVDDRSAMLRVNLRALVRAHGGIFDTFATTAVTGTSRIELKSLLEELKTKHQTSVTSTVVSTSTRDASFENAALGKQRAAEHKLAEVEAYIERKFAGFTATVNTTSSLDTSLEARVRVKLQEAKNFIVQGEAALDQGVYYKAFTSFTESMGAAQEAKILTATAYELKIDIRTERGSLHTTSTDRRGNEDNRNNESKNDDDDTKDGDEREERSENGRSDVNVRLESPVGNGSAGVRVQ